MPSTVMENSISTSTGKTPTSMLVWASERPAWEATASPSTVSSSATSGAYSSSRLWLRDERPVTVAMYGRSGSIGQRERRISGLVRRHRRAVPLHSPRR
eukprot:2977203-Rhodomonas_salina.2